MDPIKVLCVENNPAQRRVLQHLLEKVGYEVIPADSGAQAISVLAAQPISGVLLKYDLADKNGAAIRREMKQIKPEIPILLFFGVDSQTPMLLRFFDAYLRRQESAGSAFDPFYT